jgi:CRP/FNR family cyclic AMP-dependent transcriptional regulator
VCDIATARAVVSGEGWLSSTPNWFSAAVLERCSLRHYTGGETVYMVGDPPDGMYGLVAGALSLHIAPAETGPNFAFLIRPGMWIGQVAVLVDRPRLVGLSATRETWLLYLPGRAVEDIIDKRRDAWRYFSLLSYEQLELAIGSVDDLMIREHDRRLMAMLLRLGGCRVPRAGQNGPVDIDVTQEDLCVMANVGRTAANSILRRLESDGLVMLSYRRITVLAPGELRAKIAR